MIIYAKYDEDEEFADAIYIPEVSGLDIEQKQDEFFKWLFNVNNDHEYWKVIDGQKKYCIYDAEAFVKWLNEVVFSNINDKAKILRKNTNECISDSIILYF